MNQKLAKKKWTPLAELKKKHADSQPVISFAVANLLATRSQPATVTQENVVDDEMTWGKNTAISNRISVSSRY